MNDLLKFITCGSVDDGKSTLIGNMLYNAKLLFTDHENSLVLDSKIGSRNGEIDYSLLLDGLMAEREQGITIDVAYRFFNTEKRNFIVADTPGHEQYTRNMAVGASFADLAVILVDATKGILAQTKRHIRICSMMGIKNFIFAINKMDIVQYSQKVFISIYEEINAYMCDFCVENIIVIPVSATEGDNIVEMSDNTKWYTGKTFLDTIENINISCRKDYNGFAMPVQRVCRPNSEFRGFQGTVVSGFLTIGDRITVFPGRENAYVKELLNSGKRVDKISEGQAVAVVIDREIDISRGSIICTDDISMGNRINANILWMDDEELVEGRNYKLKLATKKVSCILGKINFAININSGERYSCEIGQKNDLLNCDLILSESIAVQSFDKCQELGRFILINRITNMTSACGIVNEISNYNIVYHNMDITKEIRSQQKGQLPGTIWFTGLSGSGKSTIVNELEKKLVSLGKHTMVLDGDNVRTGLNANLGFSDTDRVENIRRIAEVAKLMNDAGLIVLVSAISPFESDRQNARSIIGDSFYEIYVSTSLEECERRDIKGLYSKARRGEIMNFTGVSSSYEVPQNPDIAIDTEEVSVENAVGLIVENIPILKR